MSSIEKQSKMNARIATGITAILVLLALFFITFKVDAKHNDDEEGILVNFGTSKVGSGAVQPQSKAEKYLPKEELDKPIDNPTKVNPPPPAKAKSTSQPKVSNDKRVLTQKEETVKITEKKTSERPEKKMIKETKVEESNKNTEVKNVNNNSTSDNTSTSESTSTNESTATAQPAVNRRALYPGKQSNQSKGEGNDTAAGDKGQTDGSPDKGAYEGRNSGLGESGIGWALSGRKMIQSPTLSDQSNLEGKITVSIKVDQNGRVLATSLSRPTTISNNQLIQKALKAAKNAKFDVNKSASEEQFGTITFVFKVR